MSNAFRGKRAKRYAPLTRKDFINGLRDKQLVVNCQPASFRVVRSRFDSSQFDVANDDGIVMASCFDSEADAQKWIDEK